MQFRSLVRSTLWIVCVAAGATAQRLPLTDAPPDPAIVHVDRLCVKLAEGSGAELRDGVLVASPGHDVAALVPLFAANGAAPLVTGVPRATLDRWHAAACAVLPERDRPGNLGLWFRLRAPDAEAAVRAHAELLRHPLVRHVHFEPKLYPCSATSARARVAAPLPTDIPPTTPSFTAQQFSHGPTPAGHGIRTSAGVLGARGAGVRFLMMEATWIFGHEDVEQLVPSHVIGPVPPVDMVNAEHGLSGAAIVSASRNTYGITGIADEVDARFLSIDLNGGLENSLAIGIAQSSPGDVFLIVQAIQVPYLGPGSWVPFEFIQSAFDATRTATALNRHVVVPAGNGNRSLDDPSLLNRFDRSFRDSGAIIVASSQGGAFVRAAYSNWGSRIDAHSWGDQVVSCGYGSLFFPNNDLLQAYTNAATGTSSSTPHLAGLVCMLQGAAKRQLGAPLTNAQVVALLNAHGSTTPDVIGRRPDIVAALQAMGAIDGLRAAVPDVGLLDTITVTMDGAAGSVAALFASFGTADVPLGFNRNVHLDPLAALSVGAFVLASGTASWSVVVPNDPALHGADLYFQALRLTTASPLHVTNSCQVTIL